MERYFETVRLPVMTHQDWRTAQATADLGGWELVAVSNGYAYYKRELNNAVPSGGVSEIKGQVQGAKASPDKRSGK